MGLDTPDTCKSWRNILRISCASSWFFFTQIHVCLLLLLFTLAMNNLRHDKVIQEKMNQNVTSTKICIFHAAILTFTGWFNATLGWICTTYKHNFCKQTYGWQYSINPLNAELNPSCYLLTLLGAHHFLHVSRIRVKSLTLRLLMSYIYGAPIIDVSTSHTTTQHSR